MSNTTNSRKPAVIQFAVATGIMIVLVLLKAGIDKDIDFNGIVDTWNNYFSSISERKYVKEMLFKSQIHWAFIATFMSLLVSIFFDWSLVPKFNFAYIFQVCMLIVAGYSAAIITTKFFHVLMDPNFTFNWASAKIYLKEFKPKGTFQVVLAATWSLIYFVPAIEEKFIALISKIGASTKDNPLISNGLRIAMVLGFFWVMFSN